MFRFPVLSFCREIGDKSVRHMHYRCIDNNCVSEGRSILCALCLDRINQVKISQLGCRVPLLLLIGSIYLANLILQHGLHCACIICVDSCLE